MTKENLPEPNESRDERALVEAARARLREKIKEARAQRTKTPISAEAQAFAIERLKDVFSSSRESG